MCTYLLDMNMKILAFINVLVFMITVVVSLFIGFDLKRWTSWLLVLYAFVSGSLVGFLGDNGSIDIIGGVVFAIVVLSIGSVTNWQRRYYRSLAEPWLARHGQEKHLSFLARVIRRALNKKL
jgi:hypothetical protein